MQQRIEALSDLVDELVAINQVHYGEYERKGRVARHDLIQSPFDRKELCALVSIAVDKLAHKV